MDKKHSTKKNGSLKFRYVADIETFCKKAVRSFRDSCLTELATYSVDDFATKVFEAVIEIRRRSPRISLKRFKSLLEERLHRLVHTVDTYLRTKCLAIFARDATKLLDEIENSKQSVAVKIWLSSSLSRTPQDTSNENEVVARCGEVGSPVDDLFSSISFNDATDFIEECISGYSEALLETLVFCVHQASSWSKLMDNYDAFVARATAKARASLPSVEGLPAELQPKPPQSRLHSRKRAHMNAKHGTFSSVQENSQY